MALAALAVEFIFGHWNYTTVLNIFFLMLAPVLVTRFCALAVPKLLRLISGSGRHKHNHSQRSSRSSPGAACDMD
jgi:hypothetical protein